MPLREASLHRALGPGNLGTLSSPLLAEDREQDDPPSGRNVVGDARRLPDRTEVEAKLTELAAQLAGVRLVQVNASLRQQVDVELHATELVIRKSPDPVRHLRLQLHRAPWHEAG